MIKGAGMLGARHDAGRGKKFISWERVDSNPMAFYSDRTIDGPPYPPTGATRMARHDQLSKISASEYNRSNQGRLAKRQLFI